MASVTLGRHPARHLLDPDKLFLRKQANEGKTFTRKSSREKMTRERAAGVAAVPVSGVPLDNRQLSDGAALEMCAVTGAGQTCMAPECQTCTISRTDGDNANANNNGGMKSLPRRGSTKNVTGQSSRRPNTRSLSADGDTLEGLQLERLTQGRRGVVKLMRTDPPRRQAWSIFDQAESGVKEEKGVGHLLAPCRVTQDWCDACRRLVKTTALRCQCEL
ncbi:uncharacterized protein LOC134302146 [Trichomycterus rosablanca]|uniref:uncharacterized protein LOC134302146 n=1 Tax=Trichomycterus rosablanca TaxID=2290929 RepID=UPI002F35B311